MCFSGSCFPQPHDWLVLSARWGTSVYESMSTAPSLVNGCCTLCNSMGTSCTSQGHYMHLLAQVYGGRDDHWMCLFLASVESLPAAKRAALSCSLMCAET